MNFQEAKQQFIQSWGALATQWGINKTMAQIHAYLMISKEPRSVEDIMEELQISRGNVSMNLRELMNWGIVFKEFKPGERKEYFVSEQDVNEMVRKITMERNRREIKPILNVLQDVKNIDEKNTESEYFIQKTSELEEVISFADKIIEQVTKKRGNWITQMILKLVS